MPDASARGLPTSLSPRAITIWWYPPWDEQYDLFVAGAGTGVHELLNGSSGTFRSSGRGDTFQGLLDGWW